MHKSELIEHISAEHGCTKVEAEKVINMFTTSITSALSKGQEINLIGFGKFYSSKIAARSGRNPKTGEALNIPAYIQPKFSAGKSLKDTCNDKNKNDKNKK